MKTMKFFSTFMYLFFANFLFSETISIKVSLTNGTTGQKGFADTIKVIALQGGMLPIREIKNQSGEFIIDKLEVEPSSPLLLQATYKNANYNKMIPPTAEFRKKIQELKVYETTENQKELIVNSLLQISREENSLRIFKIFLIKNASNPLKSFYSESSPLEIFIPTEAKEISSQLTQGDSKMAIPINFTDGKKGKQFPRAILPGTSELQISYSIDAENLSDAEFTDQILFEDPKIERIIFYRPKSMKVEILNAKESVPILNDLPSGVGAYRVKYNSDPIKILVSGGKPEVKISEGRKVVNGNIFNTWQKSILGIIGVLGILFTLSFLFIFKKK